MILKISGGGGLEFLPGHFVLFHKGDGKLYFFHLRIACISTKPYGHLFVSPIFPHKKLSPPPYSNGGPLN